jgi:hypothetical protein
LLGAVVAYSAVAGDRFVAVIASVGCAGIVVTALAVAARWTSLLPWGLVGAGSAYGAFLSLRSGGIDTRAPAVAAALFVASELAYWSTERRSWRSEQDVVSRRLGLLVAAALATAVLGGLLLLIASGRRAGLGEEGAGVLASVLILTVVALLARRSRNSASA